MKAWLLIVVALVLAGCMEGMPTYIKESKSDFDGAAEYHMEPGYVYGESMWGDVFSLGALWRTNMGDRMVFLVKIPVSAVSITPQEGLQFNIDGEIVTLSSSDVVTDFDASAIAGMLITSSSRSFVGSRTLLNKMLAAQSVKVRLLTSDGYMDGDFKKDGREAAIRGFVEFEKRLPQVTGGL